MSPLRPIKYKKPSLLRQRVAQGGDAGARDAVGAGHQIVMPQHHPFRLAATARGVQQGGHVRFDAFVAAEHLQPGRGGAGRRAAQHHGAQVRAFGEHLRQRGKPFRRRHQHPRGAVAQDETGLACAQQRVERHHHGAGQRGAAQCADRVEPLVEPDRDAFWRQQAECPQAVGGPFHALRHGRMVEFLAVLAHGRASRRPARGLEN
jgi:hypothetical protein